MDDIIASFKVRLSRRLLAQLGNSRSPGHPFNCLQGDPNLGSSRLSGPAIVQIRPRIVFVMQVKRQKLEDYYFT